MIVYRVVVSYRSSDALDASRELVCGPEYEAAIRKARLSGKSQEEAEKSVAKEWVQRQSQRHTVTVMVGTYNPLGIDVCRAALKGVIGDTPEAEMVNIWQAQVEKIEALPENLWIAESAATAPAVERGKEK